MPVKDNIFLFSIDLEDIRFRMQDGTKYKERVPFMTEKYLAFLSKHKSKATFFVVGDIAETYPSLIKDIVSEGHEIACHSYRHIPVTEFTPEKFKADTQKNIDALLYAGAKDIKGYRAPVFSFTPKTPWAFEILKELGFTYSSSVLPAKHPLYGWAGFGEEPRLMSGITEIPMSIMNSPFLKVPFAGGVYFRTLPLAMIKRNFERKFSKGKPVLSYFHPYDIDTEQERFMHPDINGNRFYNFLLYHNRKHVFQRLEFIMELGCKIIPYNEYLRSVPT